MTAADPNVIRRFILAETPQGPEHEARALAELDALEHGIKVDVATMRSLRADLAEAQEREAELLVQRDELQREIRRLRATGDDRG